MADDETIEEKHDKVRLRDLPDIEPGQVRVVYMDSAVVLQVRAHHGGDTLTIWLLPETAARVARDILMAADLAGQFAFPQGKAGKA